MRPHRTIHKQRIGTCKVKTQPRHLEQIETAIRNRRPNFEAFDIGKCFDLKKTQQRRKSSFDPIIDTISNGKYSQSKASKLVSRQRQSRKSFLPSLKTYEVDFSQEVSQAKMLIVKDYSEKGFSIQSNKSLSKSKKKKNTQRVKIKEQRDIAVYQPSARQSIISVEELFEYTVKYSCRTVAGRTINGKDKVNQDCFIVYPALNRKSYKHFFAICDGHGTTGHLISHAVKQEFMRLLGRFRYSTHQFDRHCEKIISSYFLNIENYLLKNKILQSGIDFSGSTCVSVWMNNSKLYCANVGDSRAIMAIEGTNASHLQNSEGTQLTHSINRVFKVIQLSQDHKVERTDEAARVQANGGDISRINGKGPLRIWKQGENYPGLSMTRSFGDRVAHTLGVTAIPEITQYEMTRRERILVIGSDGLFEFLTNQQIIELVSRHYDSRDIDGACKELMEAARSRWQHNCKIIDDITFLVFFFGFK